jgi:hypothetical protein
MKGKILLAAGVGIGYVLGARAGRDRYEDIKRAAGKLWSDPRVQRQFDEAEGFVKDKAPEVAGLLGKGAKKVVSQVSGSSKNSDKNARKTPVNPSVAQHDTAE